MERLPNPSLIEALNQRAFGVTQILKPELYPTSVKSKINSDFDEICKVTDQLRVGLQKKDWNGVKDSVRNVATTLIAATNLSRTTSKKLRLQKREVFVSLKGFDLLLELLEPRMSGSDARCCSVEVMRTRQQVLTECLVLIREISISKPSLKHTGFTNQHLIFLFTLLSHEFLFDFSLNLLEEILSSGLTTFDLTTIPNAYSLFENLPVRYLAQSSRVLSLILFEPQDRLDMHISQVLLFE